MTSRSGRQSNDSGDHAGNTSKCDNGRGSAGEDDNGEPLVVEFDPARRATWSALPPPGGLRAVVVTFPSDVDGFEAFLQRQKQTLVYNLLDVLHLSQAQAAIVGVTSRYDVVEMMEKR